MHLRAHSPLPATIHSFSHTRGASCNLESKQFSLTGGKGDKTVSSVKSLVTGVAEDKDERKGNKDMLTDGKLSIKDQNVDILDSPAL